MKILWNNVSTCLPSMSLLFTWDCEIFHVTDLTFWAGMEHHNTVVRGGPRALWERTGQCYSDAGQRSRHRSYRQDFTHPIWSPKVCPNYQFMIGSIKWYSFFPWCYCTSCSSKGRKLIFNIWSQNHKFDHPTILKTMTLI